jgi:hypothetical protein
VTFSPDGRRVVTVSIEEGSVTVWKVGSSLSGFFNVGAPPRQGGEEKGGPFKRIEFRRADDGECLVLDGCGICQALVWDSVLIGVEPLESTTALSDVQITWPGPRSARVMIKETALTFAT